MKGRSEIWRHELRAYIVFTTVSELGIVAVISQCKCMFMLLYRGYYIEDQGSAASRAAAGSGVSSL